MSRPMEALAIASILVPAVALRGVNKEDEEYKELVESVRQRGVYNAISVREEEIEGETRYILVDGLQRYTASIDAGRDTINATVLDIDEAQSLEAQIEANVQRVKTRPVDISRQLLKILAANRDRTIEEQAKRLSKSVGWVQDMLRLQRLSDPIKKLVNDGKMPASTAYMLAKLDEDEQGNWVDQCCSLPPDQILPQLAARHRELSKLKRGEPKPEPTPTPVMRKKGEIKAQYDAIEDTDDPYKSGWNDALRWVLQMDAASQKQWHEKRTAKAEERASRTKEKEAKRYPTLDELLN